MAVTAKRKIQLDYTGDVVSSQAPTAADNTSSPGTIESKNLSSGANTITVPAGTIKAVTIVPPSGNTVTMTLKGVSGDTGVGLHLTDPTSIGLATGVTTFVITISGTLSGIRFFWS